MNAETLKHLEKCEAELKEAKEQMKLYDPYGNGSRSDCVGSGSNYSHFKRIALDLMRERREIKTGLRAW